jgi:UDP-N-acetylglucosamine--N-acetylmuramyl-(pentapeptide) pyrophosphoryl-undecaprenol N-acetylglucosamine transferase
VNKPDIVSGLDACNMVAAYGYQAYDAYRPSQFAVDNKMRLKYSSIWLLKYLSYYKKCKAIARGFIQSDEKGLVVSDEDFASISIGNEMKRRCILITDIVKTSFIKTRLLSIFESTMNKSMQEMIKGCDRVIIPEHGEDRGNISYVGPIVRNVITPNRSELRKRLGMNRRTIVVSIGGTDSGKFLINKVITVHQLLRRRLDTDLFVISGPSLTLKNSSDDFRNIGSVENLHEYIYASDLIISLAGKSTIDESAVYGTPGIFIPIKNHFEQEENARLMGYKYEDISKLESLIEDKISAAGSRHDVKVDQNGAQKAADIIANYSN